MLERMIRAAKLDTALYEEVEADPSLNSEAMQAVALASALAGLGTGLGTLVGGDGGVGALVVGVILGVILALIGYFIWAWITYFIGTRLFQGTADYGELRRTLGYAYTPNALRALIFVPVVGQLLALAAGLWALVAGVVAVRQALDFSTGKAILTVIVGWIVMFLIVSVVGGVILGGLFGAAALTR